MKETKSVNMKYYKFNKKSLKMEEVNSFLVHFPAILLSLIVFVLLFSSFEKAENKVTTKSLLNVVSHSTPPIPEYIARPKKTPSVDFVTVNGTYYNSDPSQGEGDGSTTADGSKIDIDLLNSGVIKWVALSRNLLKRFGGTFNFGDKIMIEHEDKRVAGVWIVRDCMNARFTNKIDFLIPKGAEFAGRIKDIKIKLVK